jgi:DNA-binding MarR family transcriptional regulator
MRKRRTLLPFGKILYQRYSVRFLAELAIRLSMPRPSVTVNLKRLEAAGFVRREIDPTDLRRHRILVTPAGRKIMARGLALLSEAFGARLVRLSGVEQSELKSLLEKMV